MTSTRLSYEQILVTNNLLRTAGEETYYLGVTRTVQESKFFPVSAYILLGYFNAFYRYPALLRKIEKHMRAEDIADRVRNSNSKCQSAVVNWCLTNFYLLGREMLINMGFIRPHDAAQDVFYVLDFWRRYNLAYRREDGHITCKEAGIVRNCCRSVAFRCFMPTCTPVYTATPCMRPPTSSWPRSRNTRCWSAVKAGCASIATALITSAMAAKCWCATSTILPRVTCRGWTVSRKRCPMRA